MPIETPTLGWASAGPPRQPPARTPKCSSWVSPVRGVGGQRADAARRGPGLAAPTVLSARSLRRAAMNATDGTPAAAARTRGRLALYLDLIRWDRPAGTLLLLWPTLSALWIAARGFPGWHLLAVFVLGTFLMRSAGCAANDVADRDFDSHVKRTANRPVTSGAIGVARSADAGGALALRRIRSGAHDQHRRRRLEHRGAGGDLALSIQQALLGDAASRPRRRLQLRHPDGVRGRARRRLVVDRAHSPAPCRRSPGGCFSATCSGCSPTTPSTRWSTATMTSRSASAPRRSRSAVSTSSR